MFKLYEIFLCFETFIVSGLVSFFVSFIIIKYSNKYQILLDKDNINKPQKMHFGNISRAGGIALLFSIIVAIMLNNNYNILLFIPMLFVFISGILGDINNSTNPKFRLILQILSSIFSIYLLNSIIIDIGVIVPFYIALVFSVFCIVGVTNAMNIIDGFNGLSSGFAIMVCISIFIVSYITGNKEVCYLSIALCGGLFGFILLNFPNAKIFLGDSGSYLIGFIITIMLIRLTQNDNNISAWYGFTIMIYPIFEVIFSIYRRRIIKNKFAMNPDAIHFHTLLYKRVTKINYKTSIFIWILNIPFIFIPTLFFNNVAILISLSIIFILIYLIIYFKIIRFKWNINNKRFII